MHDAATASRHSVASFDASPLEPAADARTLARRKLNRRGMLLAVAASYLVDAALFAVYAHAGATTFATPLVFGVSGIASILIFLALAEARFNDRFADHYLTLAQGFISSTIMLGGVYLAPEVGL